MQEASKTARKLALNIVTLGAIAGIREVLPSGIVEATARLLVESGSVSATGVQSDLKRIKAYRK